MTKTPYEIRLEVLRLANEILCNGHHSDRLELEQKFHSDYEKDKNTKFPTLPKAPTTEQVLLEAERLNTFISNN
jgi:hypothetical protein